MKPFRMLHITYSLNIGGLERVVVDLAKGLKKKGHIASICCLDGKVPLGEEAELAGIKVFSLNKKPGIALGLPFRLSKIITENGFNLIHTHNEAGLLYGAAAALLAGFANIVHTEHGKEPDYSNKKALHIAENLLLRKVKSVVAVSEDLKNKLVKSSGMSKNEILVISNGIDVENFYRPDCRDDKRRELGISSEFFVIGIVARLVPLKNHRFLFAIFRELLEGFANLKLIIVGDGPLRADLETFSKEMGISNAVVFLGERKDIAELLSAFDLFVLPSLTEGISITLLEAMASGTPVVASEVGGNSEVIENGNTGLLLPLDKPDEWISTIKSLIIGALKRKSLSEMAKTKIEERFSLRAMVDNYEKIYNQQ